MIALWPWALMALLVPLCGGGIMSIGSLRPDVPLAFVSAAAARRAGVVAIIPPCVALCLARYALCPPDGRTEALVFTLAVAALIIVHRVALFESFASAPLGAAVAFLALVVGTALLQRGTGASVTLPTLPSLAGTMLYTTAIAAAFAVLLPGPRSRP